MCNYLFVYIYRVFQSHISIFIKSTMNKLLAVFALFVLVSCGTKSTTKVPCFAWLGGPGEATDIELKANFTDLKEKGIDGLMYNGGHDPEVYQRTSRKNCKRSRARVSYLDSNHGSGKG